MKYIRGKSKPKVTVVCCMHGDELFGKKIFDHFASNINKYPRLEIILANTKAMRRKTRFVDVDLNRCFPGKQEGNYEEVLASKIMKVIGNSKYLIDIHTTHSDLLMTPIITNQGTNTKKILNQFRCKNIVFMNRNMAKNSMIGQIRTGVVSIEAGARYYKTKKGFKEVCSAIERLLKNELLLPTSRKVFYVPWRNI